MHAAWPGLDLPDRELPLRTQLSATAVPAGVVTIGLAVGPGRGTVPGRRQGLNAVTVAAVTVTVPVQSHAETGSEACRPIRGAEDTCGPRK